VLSLQSVGQPQLMYNPVYRYIYMYTYLSIYIYYFYIYTKHVVRTLLCSPCRLWTSRSSSTSLRERFNVGPRLCRQRVFPGAAVRG